MVATPSRLAQVICALSAALAAACADQHAGQARARTDDAGALVDAEPADPVEPDAADSPVDAGSGASMLSPLEPYQLVEFVGERCLRRSLLPGSVYRPYVLCADGSPSTCQTSIACARSQDCTGAAHGECVAQVARQCVYPDADVRCDGPEDCGHLPMASCTASAERCDDTGRCEPAQRRCFSSALEQPCERNADCTVLPGGRCGSAILSTRCDYSSCLRDDECAAGERCTCNGAIMVCVPSQCRVDGDCGTGQRCVTSAHCGDLVDGFYCTTPADACSSDAHCTAPSEGSCAYVKAQQRWRCQPACIVDTFEAN